MGWLKCHLDNCASYHAFSIKAFLKKIYKSVKSMKGNYNTSETRINKQRSYGKLKVWLNESGITNLIFVPKLGVDEQAASTDTNRE